MTNRVFTGGTQPFECTEDEYGALTQISNDLLANREVSTVRQAANEAIKRCKEQRRLKYEKERQELISAQISVFATLKISCNQQGFPEQTSANYEALLQNHPDFQSVRKDRFSDQIFYGANPITDTDLSIIYSKFSNLTKCALENRQKIYDAIITTAECNSFNQLTDYLDNLVWDQKKRVPNIFFDFLGTPRKKLYSTMATLWMIGAVKRAYEPGCKFDNIVILSGPQGIGKSNFCERLSVKPEWYCENVQIGDKDGYIQLRDSWIVNMDEIASLNKKDAATAKNFLTSRQDKFRSPYGRFTESFDSHCIFIGTTNDDNFLKDSTAVTERRYWVVPCTGTRADSIVRYKALDKEYVSQLWAEAVYYYKTNPGMPLYIPEDQWSEFVEDQLQYKTEVSSELFLFLDDALNREYVEFTDDSSLTRQYSTPDISGAVEKRQDKFSINSINMLIRDNHIVSWRGAIKQYADMHPDMWKYGTTRVSWNDCTVKGIRRVVDEEKDAPSDESLFDDATVDYEKLFDR